VATSTTELTYSTNFGRSAQGLCILLATSLKARVMLAETKQIGAMSSLVNVNNTYVVACATAAMSTFSKCKKDRRLIGAVDAEPMFHAVLKTAKWCLSELRATRELEEKVDAVGGTGGRGGNVGVHDIVNQILEHAASAAWGLSVVLANENHYEGLVEEMGWVGDLKQILFCDDERIDDCVKIAISGTFRWVAERSVAKRVKS